mgnify:CR=1 FL=1
MYVANKYGNDETIKAAKKMTGLANAGACALMVHQNRTGNFDTKQVRAQHVHMRVQAPRPGLPRTLTNVSCPSRDNNAVPACR